MVVEDHNQTELDKLQGRRNKVIDLNAPKPLKGPHHGGPFITGDFLSETATKQNRLNSIVTPMSVDEPSRPPTVQAEQPPMP